MGNQPAKRSSLFLFELMIAIFFFCIASAVCIRVFVWSDNSTVTTEKYNHAMNQVSAAAELLRAHENTSSVWKKEYPDAIFKDNRTFSIYYDEVWKPCKKNNAVYHMDIYGIAEKNVLTYTIEYKEKKETIYSLKIKKFTLEKGASS